MVYKTEDASINLASIKGCSRNMKPKIGYQMRLGDRLVVSMASVERLVLNQVVSRAA